MTPQQQILLDLLVDINKFETKCKKLNTPPDIYDLVGKLRDRTARWGTEEIVKGEEK